jgi:hypothetical protein
MQHTPHKYRSTYSITRLCKAISIHDLRQLKSPEKADRIKTLLHRSARQESATNQFLIPQTGANLTRRQPISTILYLPRGDKLFPGATISPGNLP